MPEAAVYGDSGGNERDDEEHQEGDERGLEQGLLASDAVDDDDGVLRVNRLHNSVVSVRLVEEGAISMHFHEGGELEQVLLLDRPDGPHDVEEDSLSARRSGEGSFVSPSVLQV